MARIAEDRRQRIPTHSNDHAARAAEIRQQIAQEVQEAIEWEYPALDDGDKSVIRGLKLALRIIERGGAPPTGEHS